jgi:hypothetical protein
VDAHGRRFIASFAVKSARPVSVIHRFSQITSHT